MSPHLIYHAIVQSMVALSHAAALGRAYCLARRTG